MIARLRGHRLRGVLLAALGGTAAFLLMAHESQVPRGVLWGLAALALVVVGLLDALGTLRSESAGAIPLAETTALRTDGWPRWTAPLYLFPLSLLVLVGGSLVGGYGAVPGVVLLAALVLLPAARGRPAVGVFAGAIVLFLPSLGLYGLWDPWETHYGEVAREILARNDWISLWWAQENWFWSKPILTFWAEALSMSALGVDPLPDAHPLHPEWSIRLPVLLMALGAIMAVYAAVAKVFSRRAAVLAALVLATTPHFAFLSRQAITDIPFVANMTVAICLLVLALAEPADRQVARYRLGPIEASAAQLVVASIVLLVLPQVLYLASRNITFVPWLGFDWHGDRFLYGSAGNRGVPGNVTPSEVGPFVKVFWAQPLAQAFVWALALGWLVALHRKERTARSLYMTGFYIFCGLAFMGKGIPGFALPGLVALLFLIASRRWSDLLSGQLRVARGILTVALIGLPWYVAMYLRHGPPFTDRLLIHDHINRLAAGVHGDNGSVEYFLEQLGIGLFPWVGLVPAAVTMFLWHRSLMVDHSGSAPAQRDFVTLVTLWFFATFTLFSVMITKFHHYIFPAVPPAAILVGVLLDELLGTHKSEGVRSWVAALLAGLAPVPLVLGVAGAWGDVRGVVPRSVAAEGRGEWVVEHPWDPIVCGSLIALGLGLALAAWRMSRGPGDSPKQGGIRWLQGAVVLATAALLTAFVARDLAWVTDQRPQGYERLIHLFVYNYGRPWPDHFDYRPVLTAFGLVGTGCLVVALAGAARRVAMHGLLGTALAFTLWLVNVYMVDLSPHWGQRELVQTYYGLRDGPEQPLVAWQMNWKGENFYTGNRVHVFVDLDNKKIRQWMEEHKNQRTFVVLEHSRLNNFKNLVRGKKVAEHTDPRFCNKFVLVEVTL